jgi:sulfur-carrier protein adenylyltransferase/sulfurtransferase
MTKTKYSSPVDLTAEDLKAFMETHIEKHYRLIDVRQPAEYRHEHIPGAVLMPLLEFESRLFDLSADQDLIFYCSNGARSMTAATLALDAEVTKRGIYNLAGGIMNWYGQTLAESPRVRVFDATKEITDLLRAAMNLEKGAWRFYAAIAKRHKTEPFAETFEVLAKAENTHAQTIYAIWASHTNEPPAFEDLFAGLSGDILEGGETLETVLDRARSLTDRTCLNLIELALRIEYSALDLYRTMAEQTLEPEARDTLLAVAQAEKAHMRVLTRAIETCPD